MTSISLCVSYQTPNIISMIISYDNAHKNSKASHNTDQLGASKNCKAFNGKFVLISFKIR